LHCCKDSKAQETKCLGKINKKSITHTPIHNPITVSRIYLLIILNCCKDTIEFRKPHPQKAYCAVFLYRLLKKALIQFEVAARIHMLFGVS
jgi:hypothetical protein